MCILSPDSNDTDRVQIVQERPEVNLLLQINKRFCVNGYKISRSLWTTNSALTVVHVNNLV